MSNPEEGLVTAFLEDHRISDLDPETLSLLPLHVGAAEVGTHQVLLAPRKDLRLQMSSSRFNRPACPDLYSPSSLGEDPLPAVWQCHSQLRSDKYWLVVCLHIPGYG